MSKINKILNVALEEEYYSKLLKLSEMEKKNPEEIARREIKGYIQMKQEELKTLSLSL